jgi:predicted nucleotide-binding protein
MARRGAAQPEPPRANLTVDQMRRGIDRINKRIAELEAFDPQTVQKRWSPEAKALEAAIKEALAVAFGHNTVEYKRYEDAARLDTGSIVARHNTYGRGPDHQDAHEARQYLTAGKQKSLTLLRRAVQGLQEEIADHDPRTTSPPVYEIEPQRDLSKVFVVHGHDDATRETVARFIEKLGFEAIILHERPNKGRTIITKFREEAAGVGFAVVLMTPDDVGGKAFSHATGPVQPRARQNVVFELGFFIGALGPERVTALVKGEVERPSDFEGVVYIQLDSGSWKADLARELEAADYHIDWNKAMRA